MKGEPVGNGYSPKGVRGMKERPSRAAWKEAVVSGKACFPKTAAPFTAFRRESHSMISGETCQERFAGKENQARRGGGPGIRKDSEETAKGVTRGNRTLIHGTTNHCPAIER